MCKGGIKTTIILSTILSVVLSVLIYWNILTLQQIGNEVKDLTTYFHAYVNKPVINIDFEKLRRANILIINGEAAGSGTVISMEDGYIYILTARHIAESQKEKDILEIEIPLADKLYQDMNKRHPSKEGYQYVVVDKEKDVVLCDDYDMALIRIKDFAGHELSWIPPGKVDPKLGDTIYTVGNPMCVRDVIARGLFDGVEIKDGIEAYLIYGGITYGNSGGAVVNDKGELIGVVFAKCIPFPISYVGVTTTRKQTITFICGAFDAFQKENTTVTK